MQPEREHYDFRPHANALASARELGFVSVILDPAPSRSLQSIVDAAARAAGCAVQWKGDAADARRRRAHRAPRGQPHGVPDDAGRLPPLPGRAAVGLGVVTALRGLPGFETGARRMMSAFPDPWAEQGRMRGVMHFLVELLEAHGTGVVVHRAGHVAWTKSAWLHQVGNPRDASERPLGALIDPGVAGSILYTEGMDALALPDVWLDMSRMPLDEDERWDRASSAVLVACHMMAFENRVLRAGECLRVPVGIEVGRRRLEDDNLGLSDDPSDDYDVADEGSHLTLVPRTLVPPVAEYRAAAVSRGVDLPHSAYRYLLKKAVGRAGWQQTQRRIFGREAVGAEGFAHEVVVFDVPDRPASVMTCGLGRRRQPGGRVETDDAFVELLVRTRDPHPHVVNLLAYLGVAFHGGGPTDNPWGPEHRIAVAGPFADAGFPWVALGWAGRLEIGEGQAVSLFAPVPMTDSERTQVSMERLSEWIVQVGVPSNERRWRAAARVPAR